MSARIVIISGSPGTGKTSISRLLAENSTYEKAANIHVDDFWQYIRKGYIHPWLSDSGDQNQIVVECLTASAERFAAGDYEVIVDGAIGIWFLEPWLDLAKKGFDVRYIMLRPDEQATISRVINREQNANFPLTIQVIKDLWEDFSNLGEYESHKIDTTDLTADETAEMIEKMLAEGEFII